MVTILVHLMPDRTEHKFLVEAVPRIGEGIHVNDRHGLRVQTTVADVQHIADELLPGTLTIELWAERQGDEYLAHVD